MNGKADKGITETAARSLARMGSESTANSGKSAAEVATPTGEEDTAPEETGAEEEEEAS